MSAARGRVVTTVVALLTFAAPLVGAGAGASLADVKRLYEAASFENALTVLGELDAEAEASPDAFEYRALCLVALGRSSEAQAVVDALVVKVPTFVPTGDDTSPRFVALLNDARRRLLADITKRLFNDAREQFRAKNQVAARQQFEQVLRLTDDGSWGETSEAEDLRTLAAAFLEVVNAIVTPVDESPSTAAESRSSAPEPVTLPAATTIGVSIPPPPQRVNLQLPVAIEQAMPKWRPTDVVTAQRHFTGAVRVRIGKDGRVTSADIEVATDPAYDKELLEAAKSWRYRPGQRNGEPIEMEKLVTYSLRVY
jgi:TonB family protein